jgi:V/A-type H+-transporting ATPase subunit A
MTEGLRRGEIVQIKGTVIMGKGIDDVKIGEIAEVGDEGLIGEVIQVIGNEFAVQVYENTSGLKPGEKIIVTGKMLVVELGPGLIGGVFDGVDRPLDELYSSMGPFVGRGIRVNPLNRKKKWHFKPRLEIGSEVSAGDIIGEVEETSMVVHKIMVPPGLGGKLLELREGDFTVEEEIGAISVDGTKKALKLMQEWPVRVPRPIAIDGRLEPDEPLTTGQRVIDVFFPLPKGGTASIPGGFGTGKTVLLHTLAKWSDVDIVVYIGCGERGNEMCEVLTDFPKLKDPRTGRPLMERTVLIANTSNMPVAAREASIYIGITICEYFRDQGYDVALMADSTSRWAEALREISGSLEEMPVERGFPAYLPDRVAEFYERGGKAKVLGRPERTGSVTMVGAVSPPGGDFNEPVTIHTMKFTGTFWGLDETLAYRRHFPAINWLKSYSLYSERLSPSLGSFSKYEKGICAKWDSTYKGFDDYRKRAMELMKDASEVESIAKVIGESALPDNERMMLLTTDLLKEGFLTQHAYDEVDGFCEMEKQFLLLQMIIDFHEISSELVKKGVPVRTIRELPYISRMKRVKEDRGGIQAVKALLDEVCKVLEAIGKNAGIVP